MRYRIQKKADRNTWDEIYSVEYRVTNDSSWTEVAESKSLETAKKIIEHHKLSLYQFGVTVYWED